MAEQTKPQIMRWIWNGKKYKKAGETPYKKKVDAKVPAKPVGMRFTDEGAKKVGVSKYKTPTKAEVEAYKKKKTRSGGKIVYRETRKNKTDVKPKSRM